MDETGGPVELMDASVDSLEPFWGWYLGRLEDGFPEASHGSTASRIRFLGSLGADDLALRATYAIEPMAHYLLEVIAVYSPEVRWGLYPATYSDDSSLNSTVLLAPEWDCIPAEDMVFNLAVSALQGRPGAGDPSVFRAMLVRRLDLEERPRIAPRSGSILTPYLSLPRVPMDDPARIPPVVGAEPRVDSHPERAPWSDQGLMVADLEADIENVAGIRPLDVDVFAAGLTALGCHRDGAPVTAAMLRNESTQLLWRDSLIEIGPVVEGGRLRILNVKPIRLSDAEWDEFEAGITRLAVQHHAQLGTYDMFGPYRTER
jgi:hypothetical protein